MTFFKGRHKNKFFTLGLILIILSACFFYKKKQSFEYFHIDCAIFNRELKLVYSLPNFLRCIFNDDGSVLAASSNSKLVKFIDHLDQEIWTSDSIEAHHDINRSVDGKNFLFITSMFSEIDKNHVRSDCVSVMDLAGNILKQWCLSEHIDDMRKRGIGYKVHNEVPFFGKRATNFKPAYEISHFNSFYEIKKNSRSDKDNIFRAGNYIINDWGSENIMFVLDSQMKNILWHKSFSPFAAGSVFQRLRVHDVQITSEGNILAYANAGQIGSSDRRACSPRYLNKLIRPRSSENKLCIWENKKEYSQLIEFDPYTEKIYWHYLDNPKERFNSKILGSVKKLSNGNYLYSDVTNGGRAFEITEDGRKIWQFENTVKDEQGKPMDFQSVRPLESDSFLRSRKIIR